MGIGISYTGRDGATRTMQAESPQEVQSALQLAMGANAQTMDALGKRAQRSEQHITNITNILKKIRGEDDGDGEKKEGAGGKVELDPNGSLTEGLQGLALKGDMPDGMARLQAYGETDEGKRGFWYLEDFDPAKEAGGAAIGDSTSQSEEADQSKRDIGERVPFTLPCVSRIAIVEDKTLPYFVHIYVFVRYVSFTGFGRVCGVSGEERINLGMYNLKSAEEDSGGGGIPVPGVGCYTIVDFEGTKYLANQYYLDGAVAKSTNFTEPLDSAYGQFLALRVPMGTSGSPTLETYGTYSALQTASLDPAYVTLALYHLDNNGDVLCDFRNIPRVQAVEDLYQPS